MSYKNSTNTYKYIFIVFVSRDVIIVGVAGVALARASLAVACSDSAAPCIVHCTLLQPGRSSCEKNVSQLISCP